MLLSPRAAVPRPRQLIMAALGRPVEPDVKTIKPISSNAGPADWAAASVACSDSNRRPSPTTSAKSSRPSRSYLRRPRGSITTTARKNGRRVRTSSTLSSCSWSSQTMMGASDNASRYSTSWAGDVGYTPAVMPPTIAIPSSAKAHSRQFSLRIATHCPGSRPSCSRPRPNQRDCCAYCAQVTVCQMPNSFCRSATLSGQCVAQYSNCWGSGRSFSASREVVMGVTQWISCKLYDSQRLRRL